MGFNLRVDGIIDRDNRQVGYVKDSVVYSGGNGLYGGRQAGYIVGDEIMAGGNGLYGGKQVGYIDSNFMVYEGGNGQYGGTRVGPAEQPHPHWHAAANLLLT